MGVDLPLTFLGQSDVLQIHWPKLDHFSFNNQTGEGFIMTAGTNNPNVNDANETPNAAVNQIILPDLAELVDGFTVADGVYALVAGIEGIFNAIKDKLGDDILGIPIPVIGEALEDIVGFVDTFKGDL